MSARGALVVATVDRGRGSVLVSGTNIVDLIEAANVRYRITGSGAAIIAETDLTDVEVACAASFRPIRIQSKRAVTK